MKKTNFNQRHQESYLSFHLWINHFLSGEGGWNFFGSCCNFFLFQNLQKACGEKVGGGLILKHTNVFMARQIIC